MKLFSFLTSIMLIAGLSASAQVKGGHNTKLAKMYNSGKYELCLFKADDLCNDPAAGRESEPYLYAAMCMVKLYESDDPDVRADYKDGMRQAVKYAQKFVRKDDGEIYAQNQEFLDMLRKSKRDEIKKFFDNKQYSKAAAEAKNYAKLSRNTDYSFLYFTGICHNLSNNSVQGEHDMDEARENLKEQIVNNTVKFDPIVKGLISNGIFTYSQSLNSEGKKKEAIDVITLGKKLFPNDGYITVQYNMLTGNK